MELFKSAIKKSGVELGMGPADPILHKMCSDFLARPMEKLAHMVNREDVSMDFLDDMVTKTIFTSKL